jgi:superfamily I DNA/RNA helicase
MEKNFKPSPYQVAIFDFIDAGRGSAVIEAVAGSGKTSTIVAALERIPSDKSVTFLAFNKSIADELKTRVPKNCRAATFHSQGFSAWTNFVGRGVKIQVDANKCRGILDDVLRAEFGDDSGFPSIRSAEPGIQERETDELVQDDRAMYQAFVLKMVSLSKGAGMGYLIADDPASWFALADHFDVYLESDDADETRAFDLCRRVLKRSIETADKVIDFDDMLFMPLIRNVRFWTNDYVFVDESQDTNGVQLALLPRMLKPGTGRLVAVGDSRQAIYGFRGADSNAMKRIKDEFGAQSFPLSVSYRCPRAVVAAAQEFVPTMESFDGAPDGVVRDLGDAFGPQSFNQDDAIICRNTAPLVDLAYSLIRAGVGCRILGREIGTGLVALIRKMNARGVDALVEKLGAYRDREIAKYVSKGRDDKAEQVADRVDCILTVIGNLPETRRTVPALIADLEKMFDDNGGRRLTLATVHKSKGLEFDRVFILGRFQLMPSPWAKKDWQVDQETNLIYVAITRAKRELYYIDAPARKK